MAMFWTSSAVMPTTAANATTATGVTIKTMVQVSTPSTRSIRVVAFGVEFANALTAACTVELVDTGTVPATGLTAAVAAGVQPYGLEAQSGTSAMTLGTGNTGYWVAAAAEGSTTSTRTGKYKIMPVGATSYEWEWSLGREFAVPPSHFLRVRLTTATTVNALTWVAWDE